MEWLSHTQKKHCELCKTPFRFTKLYDPHMPRTLPTSVFLQRAALHGISYVTLWCRTALVASVWLLCLPWTMRYTWRMIFWFGDAGWARDVAVEWAWPFSKTNASLQAETLSNLPKAFNSTFTIPSSLILSSRTLNASLGEPILYKVAKTLLSGAMLPFGKLELLAAMSSNLTDYDAQTLAMIKQKHSSILSEVRFLKHLTDSPVLNRIFMDVLEGGIITLAVVVAFILVFLIREWVVQQQPVVDLGVNNNLVNALEQAGGQAQQPDAEEDEDDTQNMVIPMDFSDSNSDSDTDFDSDVPLPRHGSLYVQNHTDRERQLLMEAERSRHIAGSVASQEHRELVELPSYNFASSPQELAPEIQEALQTRNRQHSSQEAAERTTAGPSGTTSRVEATFAEGLAAAASEERSGDTRIDEKLTQLAGTAENPDQVQESDEHHLFLNDEIPESRLSEVPRPNMPSRGRSFIASDIQRNLEEKALDSSENSLGSSWQDVAELEERRESSRPPAQVEKAQPANHSQFENGGYSSKGKERASDDGRPEDSSVTASSAQEAVVVDMLSDKDVHLIPDQSSNPEDPRKTIDLSAQIDDPNDAQAEAIPNSSEILPTDAHDPNAKRGWLGHVFDWFWGDLQATQDGTNEDLAEVGANDERIVDDVADEEPFVPFEDAQPVLHEHEPREGAVAPEDGQPPAGNQPIGFDLNDGDAADDVEDLEGVLELIGMQGPIMGLFQNALFSSLLITGTIVCSVFLPYLLGKVVLLFIGTPSLLWKMPLQIASVCTDLTADILAFLGGHAAWLASKVFQLGMRSASLILGQKTLDTAWATYQPGKAMADRAGTRIFNSLAEASSIDNLGFLQSSMRSHQTIKTLQHSISLGTEYVGTALSCFRDSSVTTNAMVVGEAVFMKLPVALYESAKADVDLIISIAKTLWKNAGSISLTVDNSSFDPELWDPLLAYWSAKDRMAAVLTGYAWLACLGAFYVSQLAPVMKSQNGRRLEQVIVEAIQQAGGVFKVIFIISIEMIAFPLFCGFLLDMALLPLFEHSTFLSRVAFTLSSPWTSGFVHWFVGTCYMFHFALFVSMCRKIMRSGVLYFIRDPDDPNFHPVRDVLERSVAVQLRKIAFSAIVYGTLIVVCLGAVVWGLWSASVGILPIHWTSSESALEFPLDILFYNFLTPVVVRYAKPTDGLHSLYKWWFKRCARGLRLSEFLLDEAKIDEQGRHVRRTWKAWLLRQEGDVENPGLNGEKDAHSKEPAPEVYFELDGKFVRAPASDQIRIQKGKPVFVEVDADNNRLDKKEGGVHGRDSNMVKKVYIPPWFRVRIALFTLAVWLFAATTGLSVTIVPLLFGRKIFSLLITNAAQVNDIYAFSLGAYSLGAFLYVVLHIQTIFSFIRLKCTQLTQAGASTFTIIASYAAQGLSVLYVYLTTAIGLPLIFAVTLQLYVLMPLHMYFGPTEKHTIHIVQDCTLGILYVRIFGRLLLEDLDSLISLIVESILADGYLRPRARLATRALFFPALLLFAAITLIPYALAQAANVTLFTHFTPHQKMYVVRMAYPFVASTAAWVWCGVGLAKATGRWRQRIKDEAYLIGERLHNFGEARRPVTLPAVQKGSEKGKATDEGGPVRMD